MRQAFLFSIIVSFAVPCLADTLVIDPNGAIDFPPTPVPKSMMSLGNLSVNTFYITPDGTGDYATIQEAVDNALNGDQIVLSDGLYVGQGNRDINVLGKAITIRSENGPNNCIIDCQGTISQFHRGFLCENDEGNNTVIEGLTIINGYQERGGAIYLKRASPVIRNCIFHDNDCTHEGGESGGAIFAIRSKYKAFNCLFYRNDAEGDGGAIFNNQTNSILINCTFINNSADDGNAMFNYTNSQVTFINCLVFEGPKTALVNQSGSHLTITNCNIVGRTVNFSSGISTITYVGTNISEDPLFLDASQDDYKLYYDSPCIDAGSLNPQLPAFDIRGNQRLIDGNNDSDIQPDIGAYEMDAPDVPVLFVSQKDFVFDLLESDPEPQSQTLSIWNGSPESIAWEIQDTACDWLTITPTSGTASGTKNEVTLSVDASMLTKGTYQCEVDIHSDIAVNTPKTISVGVNVEGPIIDVSPLAVNFTVSISGETPPTQDITITNAGGGILNWQIAYSCDWLTINMDSGNNGMGQSTDVTLSAITSGLEQGVYDCSLEITDENAENNPFIIPVRLFIQTKGDIYVPVDYPTIQDAVNHANDGQTITVLDGTYTGDGNYMINFYGKEITVQSLRGYQKCIIECVTHDDSSGFIFSNSETNQSIVDGFTIINAGRSGIFCINNSNPTIRNCRLSNNTASVANPSGGGLYCRNSSPTLEDCIIENNYISQRSGEFAAGAGIYAELASVIIDRCVVRNNVVSAEYAGNIFGGGIFTTDSTIQIKNSLIVNNACDLTGQAEPIYLFGGGGLCNMYSIVDIVNSTITDNFSDGTAGGIFSYSGVASFKNSIVANNPTWDVYEICVEGSEYKYGYPSMMSIAGSNISPDNNIYVGSADRLNLQQGNIRTNPLFVDNLSGNYQLRKDSPCIDAGINWLMDAEGKDLTGGTRLSDGDGNSIEVVDMGCYEFIPQIKSIKVNGKITPQSLNRKSHRSHVIGILELTGYSSEDIDPDESMILIPGNIESERIDIQSSKKKGESVSLQGYFDNESVMNAIEQGGSVEVTIGIRLRTGQRVYGVDTVKVK